ncbi:MAG TPA: heavy metal translocating P-type ATPase, partial [Anaerolineaceae bacterium]
MDQHQHHDYGKPPTAAAGGAGEAAGPAAVSAGATTSHAGHGGHEGMIADFRRRFWICLLLSIPVLLFSPMLQMLLGFPAPVLIGSAWIGPAFAVVVFAVGGVPFLQMAVPEIRSRQPGMMTLISLAISVAFFYSLATVIFSLGGDFFWELVTLIDIMLLGHWLEMRSVRQASGALNELARLMPDTAERITGGDQTEKVAAGELRSGDLVLIRPGVSLPADGVVESGESEVNEAMITGESIPVKKHPGDKAIGGTINGDGSLRLRVTASGRDTALAGIMRLVEQAQQSKSSTQLLADKAAGWLFYAALGVAVLTAVGWLLATGFHLQVIERVVTVLVIACPHALGLAIPLVVAITTTLGARNGVLIRSRLALETARDVDVVVFDKTGTLTEGKVGLAGSAAAPGADPDKALALAAAIEGDSEHALARAVRQAAAERRLTLPRVDGFEALKGRGVKASLAGQPVFIGGPALLEELKIPLSTELASFGQDSSRKGQTVVYLVEDGHASATFALADVIRPESREAVQRLHALGKQVVLLTGDSQAVAEAVASELGIDQVFA